MGRRLADQRHIVFTLGCEGRAFPLITVEDYPHVSLAADQARDRSFVRAEPLEHLVDGPRVAREFPSIDVKNGYKKRPRNRGCGERVSRGAEKLRASLRQFIPPGERDQRDRRRYADEVSGVAGGTKPPAPEHQRMRDEQNQKSRDAAREFAAFQQPPQPTYERRD